MSAWVMVPVRLWARESGVAAFEMLGWAQEQAGQGSCSYQSEAWCWPPSWVGGGHMWDVWTHDPLLQGFSGGVAKQESSGF